MWRSNEESNGMLIITKTVENGNPIEFIKTLIEIIDIPHRISVDFAGFLVSKEGGVKFEFPSKGSSLLIFEDRPTFLVDSTEDREKIFDHFSNLDISKLKIDWMEAHDGIGLFSASGLSPSRFITTVCHVEPISVKVETLFESLNVD